jgi:hypothetical protein
MRSLVPSAAHVESLEQVAAHVEAQKPLQQRAPAELPAQALSELQAVGQIAASAVVRHTPAPLEKSSGSESEIVVQQTSPALQLLAELQGAKYSAAETQKGCLKAVSHFSPFAVLHCASLEQGVRQSAEGAQISWLEAELTRQHCSPALVAHWLSLEQKTGQLVACWQACP